MGLASWIENPSALSADLKRQAHDVRQAVDARPIMHDAKTGKAVNPRLARKIAIPVGVADYRYDAPELAPDRRHRLAWGER